MPEFTHILESLGWALIHSSWQGIIAFLAVIVIRQLTSDGSPSFRFGAQFLILIGCLIAFISTFARYLSQSDGAAGMAPGLIGITAPSNIIGNNIAGEAAMEAVGTAGLSMNAIIPVLGVIWCIGFSLMAARYFGAYILTRRIYKFGREEAPHHWNRRFRTLVLNSGVSEKVKLYISDRVTGPVTIGFFKPIVLVPVGFFTRLPQDQIEAILLHEIAHIRRYDYLINLVQTAIKTVFFFHPAIHYICRQIDNDREQACDDLAVRQIADGQILARGLAALRMEMEPKHLALAADNGKTPLTDRLKRLTGQNEIARRPDHLLMSVLTLVLIGGIYISASPIADARSKVANAPHVDKDVKNYTFETATKKDRSYTVKVTENGTRWVNTGKNWYDFDKTANLAELVPAGIPEKPRAPALLTDIALTNASPEKLAHWKNKLDRKSHQFAVNMDYYDAALEHYAERHPTLSEQERERLARDAEQAERDAEQAIRAQQKDIEQRIAAQEAQAEQDRAAAEKAMEQAELAREKAELQREHAELEHEQHEIAREQAERQREQVEMAHEKAERDREAAERAREKTEQDEARQSYKKEASLSDQYDRLRDQLLDRMLVDGLIQSKAETVIFKESNGASYVNGVRIPREVSGKYCAIFSANNIKKDREFTLTLAPNRVSLKSETSPGEKHTSWEYGTPSIVLASQSSAQAEKDTITFIKPLNTVKINARFGVTGKHWPKEHGGLDLGAPTGTDIMATAQGKVISVSHDKNWGKRIIIEHADGYASYYAHLNTIYVQSGQRVQAGEIIGAVGSTGKSTGPHLHFEIRKDGKRVNPEYLIQTS